MILMSSQLGTKRLPVTVPLPVALGRLAYYNLILKVSLLSALTGPQGE